MLSIITVRGMGSVAHGTVLLKLHVTAIQLIQFTPKGVDNQQPTMLAIARDGQSTSFSRKYEPLTPPAQNAQVTVTFSVILWTLMDLIPNSKILFVYISNPRDIDFTAKDDFQRKL